MTDEQETSRSIDEKAANWIARLDRGPLSAEETRTFEAWLHGDARRCGALLRAGSLALLSESAPALGLHRGALQEDAGKTPSVRRKTRNRRGN